MVILRNRTRSVRVYNLPHAHYCRAGGPKSCHCSLQQHSQPVVSDAGETGVLVTERRICASTTILAGAESESLEDAVLDCPDVRRDLDRGVLTVVQQKPTQQVPEGVPDVPPKERRRAKEPEK